MEPAISPVRPSPGKTLIIDIETSPIEGLVWGTWKQNLTLDQIQTDWSILSYAAKWAGDSKVFYEDSGEESLQRDEQGVRKTAGALTKYAMTAYCCLGYGSYSTRLTE